MIIDEIQESAAIYNRIRGFTRQLKSDFIITGSYLGRILNREFKYSAGDLDSLEIHTLDFREFLQGLGEADLYEKLDLYGQSTEEVYQKLSEYYRIYTKIGGYPAVVLRYGRTIGETQKALVELKYRLEHGMYTNNVRMTFDEWFNRWMEEYKKNQVKIGTYLNYQKYYAGMIKGAIGQKQINSIRGDDIQKIYNSWVKKEYAISTIKIASAVLNGCFKQAEKNGLIERNPVKLATLPRKEKRSKKMKVLTKNQQILFMEYAKQSYLYNLFAVMLRTGMRSGEARGLIYGLDIDKKKRVIHIQRTLKYESGMGFFTDTPKTKSSEREIPLTKEVEHYLDDQQKLWWGNIIRMDRFLFCNYNGDPLSRECVQGEIDRIVERIRKDGHTFPRITSHVFRHTFATRAIEAGMKPQVLKSILGHSSLAMTMDLYSHVLPDTKAEEMEMIAKAF